MLRGVTFEGYISLSIVLKNADFGAKHAKFGAFLPKEVISCLFFLPVRENPIGKRYNQLQAFVPYFTCSLVLSYPYYNVYIVDSS